MRLQAGFTLIELVTVIVLIGVLAVTVLPRFSSRSGFAEYALRDQVISTLRFAQQRAMYDHNNNCYGVSINVVSVTSIIADGTPIPSSTAIMFADDYTGLSVAPSPQNIYFDGLGNALVGADCATAVTLPSPPFVFTVNGGVPLTISLHSTGYVTKP